jgi:hypothetical protein
LPSIPLCVTTETISPVSRAVEAMNIRNVGDVDLHLLHGEVRQIAFLDADRLRGGRARIGQRGETGGRFPRPWP